MKYNGTYLQKYLRHVPHSKGMVFNGKFYIHDCGITYPHPNFMGADTNRQTVHFEYVLSGKEYFEYEGKKQFVTAGYSVIVPNHVNVSYYSDKREPCTRLWFSVWGDYPDALLKAFFPEETLIVRKCNLFNLFDGFLSSVKDGSNNMCFAAHTVLEIVLEMAGMSETESTDEPKTLSEHIKEYIDSHLSEELSMSLLSEKFIVSERTISENFKKSYGVTPSAYKKESRLVKAAELLSQSDSSIKDIAERLGYCAVAYFSNEFCEKYGVRPTEYRKRCKT